ncbi:MAG: hypothetical protein KatS3mg109_0154 [Pirellulaceae bacterium]|nr:MAG: hypothetical protein KatS3mg109_0154 [Pirellulaceae bacterium]
MKYLLYVSKFNVAATHYDLIVYDGARLVGHFKFCNHGEPCDGRHQLPVVLDMGGVAEPRVRLGFIHAKQDPTVFSVIVPVDQFNQASSGIIQCIPIADDKAKATELDIIRVAGEQKPKSKSKQEPKQEQEPEQEQEQELKPEQEPKPEQEQELKPEQEPKPEQEQELKPEQEQELKPEQEQEPEQDGKSTRRRRRRSRG